MKAFSKDSLWLAHIYVIFYDKQENKRKRKEEKEDPETAENVSFAYA